MSIIYKSSSSASGVTLTALKYGSTNLTKVIYKSSSSATGVTVFEKTASTITETFKYTYRYYGSQSGATFYYPTTTCALSHTPIKVTSIGKLLGGTESTIDSGGLSGHFTTLSSSGSSSTSRTVPWSISGSNIVVSGGDTNTGNGSTTLSISITYQYYS